MNKIYAFNAFQWNKSAIYLLTGFIATFVSLAYSQVSQSAELKDARDGNIYKTIQIGNQIWMAENLNYKTQNSFCENETECKKIGRFYSWRAAMESCPEGWHLPSRDEWLVLRSNVKKAESLYEWDEDYPEIEYYISSPNFNALNAGRKESIIGQASKEGAYFWTSTKYDNKKIFCTYIDDLDYDSTKTPCNEVRMVGMSVRCIKGIDSSVVTEEKKPSIKKGIFVDPRDKREYKTVQINQQTWFAENLKFAAKNSLCHNNDQEECEKYGRLYKWDDAMSACPTGWHLPSKYEVKRFLWIIGDNSGEKLKSKTEWENDNNGWDDYEFNVLPVGAADLSNGNVTFDRNGLGTAFWTSNHDGNDFYKWFFFSQSWYSYVGNTSASWTAEPVRCIKDYVLDVIATGTFQDKRDKKKYKTVTLGNQTWMAENLQYASKGSVCYDNDKKNCQKFGRLYTWEQAKEACPLEDVSFFL